MTLDELLLEWSYRTQRGYPKLDDPSDVLILKELLEKLDIPVEDILNKLEEEETDVAGLEPSEFSSADDDGDGIPDVKQQDDKEDTTDDDPTTIEKGDVTLDEVIEFHLEKNGLWEGSIPQPKGIYKFNGQYGGTFDEKVVEGDMEVFHLL